MNPLRPSYKVEWQRRNRRAFVETMGFSSAANYATGKLRQQVLERDGHKCVRCGMTDVQHRAKWSRPITVDHKDKNRKHNTLENLQTLCLHCHGNKDLIASLRTPRVVSKKDEILQLRASGSSYQHIAEETGFSIGAVWKWIRIWQEEEIAK